MVLPSGHSLSPAPESPAVSWSLPLALPSQDRGHGDRGRALLPGAPSSWCSCSSWSWLCTSNPRDGPSLTVPCHQGPQPGPRDTAGSEESGGPGRVPGKGSRGQAGLGRSSPASQPSPGPGQGSAGTHKYQQGQILPRSCEQRELLRTGSPSQGRSRGGRGAKVTRRNEGEPLRPESPRGERPDPPSACAKVGGGRKTN